jgi:mono/diheme cytochrome c family protein
MNTMRRATAFALTLLAGACAAPAGEAQPPPPPTPPPPAAAQAPAFLDQGWSAADRDWMYGFSQGSQIIPYDWFLALEVPEGGAPFRADGLARHGYLPRPPGPANRDGLPVGFGWDRDGRGWWFSMNCAACHTGQIHHAGRTWQVDGAPGNGNLYALIRDLSAAMAATLADPARFDRFAAAVRRPADPQTAPGPLRERLRATSEDWARFVEESTPRTTPWGPARADAFGMIFNRVARIDLGVPANAEPPEAPVSFPFLWTTARQDWIQWDGSVPNENWWERLGRNAGQVLGVFGTMPTLADRAALEREGFVSSVHGRSLLRADRLVARLRPPRWEALGLPVDAAMRDRGAAVYRRVGCGACHAVAARTEGIIRVERTPLDRLGTDALTAERIAARTVATGPLEGWSSWFVDRGRPLRAREPAAGLLSAVVTQVLLDWSTWRAPSTLPPPPLGAAPASTRVAPPSMLAAGPAGAAADVVATALARSPRPVYLSGGVDPATLRYKAGPLDGVWATGPFLHNGSVPTLRDLLLPPEQRPRRFRVGDRTLDTEGVGFRSGPDAAGFEFDTERPGNGNGGHAGPEYGTELSPEERRDLLEYLKSL